MHLLYVRSSVSNITQRKQFKGTASHLRAVVSNFRESGDRSENSNFFLFVQKDPIGELFSKIIFKSSSEFLFWQKLGKFEIGLNVPLMARLKLCKLVHLQNSRSRTRKRFLELMFSR